jgi:nitroreductase
VTDLARRPGDAAITDLIRQRHSERSAFNPDRPVKDSDVAAILEAARWAPTAHNMQNFEVLVVDDPGVLNAIGRVHSTTTLEFIAENYRQLSFSEDELIHKGTGMLAASFPPEWRNLQGEFQEAADMEHGFLDSTMRSCPLVLIVLYDPRRRAPASANDFLGVISLGCVMENMWLTADALGISVQVMSVFSGHRTEAELQRILEIPRELRIAYALRLGYPREGEQPYLRVRRRVERFAHRNIYGAHFAPEPTAT